MWLKDFILNRSRVALAWVVVLITGLLGILAAISKQWDTVDNSMFMLASIVGAYNFSQGWTKTAFIKRAGKVDGNLAEKVLEP